jgi:hypothetical protein
MTHDALRFDFIVESAELLASYSISLSEAGRRSNAEACRVYFDCLRAIARDLNKTLSEVENGLEGQSRQTNGGMRVEGGRVDDALRGDNGRRSVVANGDHGRPRGQVAA